MSIDLMLLSGPRRLPVIRQSEAAECGLACLAMVAGYHGFETSLSILRRRFNTTLRGMNLAHLVDTADRLGLSSRALKMPIEILDQLKLPAVLHWNLNHFVVLKSVSAKGCVIHDPGVGVRQLSMAEVSKSYTGVALELSPAEHFERRSEKLSLRIRDLWGSLSGLKRGLVQLVILSLFMQAYVLISPFFLQLVVDDVVRKSSLDLLVVLALGFGGFATLSALGQVLRNYVVLYLGATISFQVASNLFRHLLNLPIDYFEKRHMGDVVSRFQSIEPIKKMLTEGLIGSLIDGMMAVTTLVMMFIYSPKLAAVSVLAWGSYFLMRMGLYYQLRESQQSAIEAAARENSKFMESVSRVTSLKLFGGERDRHRLWQNLYADALHHDIRVQKLKTWFEAASVGLMGVELVVLVYIAAGMMMSGGFTVGMLFAFLAYRTSFSTKASALVERAVDFRMLGLHLERLADIVQTEAEDAFGDMIGHHGVPLEGRLELRNISYRYSDNDPMILRDVNVTIEPGECVAIVGETGCGKSTLLKIMTTLFRPDTGEMLVDGKNIRQMGVLDYRRQIGVVMQDDGLLSGTLADNIAFFDPELDTKRMVDAARQAAILEDIARMPMQFETLVGDMGMALSGGQKQRLAIARALYRQPKILFMDEGTSHLDVGTEKRINDTVANLGITRIIVAHRPETIRSADRVLLCEGGVLKDVEGDVVYGDTRIEIKRKSRKSFTPKTAEKAASGAEAGFKLKPINQGAVSS